MQECPEPVLSNHIRCTGVEGYMGWRNCKLFDVTVNGNLAVVLDQVRSKIVGAGGNFSGDTTSGAFSGPSPVGMIEGKYSVRGNVVTITITSKPIPAPCGMIESETRDYFKQAE